jgi:hypothetical protein
MFGKALMFGMTLLSLFLPTGQLHWRSWPLLAAVAAMRRAIKQPAAAP